MTKATVSFVDFLQVAVPLFVVVWCTVSYVISRFGWQRFASRYGTSDRPDGRAYNVALLSFGTLSTTYRNAARVVFTPRGIYVRMIFISRPFNPPFLVPWSIVKSVHPSWASWAATIMKLSLTIRREAYVCRFIRRQRMISRHIAQEIEEHYGEEGSVRHFRRMRAGRWTGALWTQSSPEHSGNPFSRDPYLSYY